MGVIVAIALKDLLLLLRDRMGMFFVIVFPILFGLFTGVVFSGISESPPEMSIGIVDEDRSEYSQKFIQYMHEVSGAQPLEVDLSEAERDLRMGQMHGYIRIPSGFGETAGMVLADPPTVFIKADQANYAGDERIMAVVYQIMMLLASDRLDSPGLLELIFGPPKGGHKKLALVNVEVLRPADRAALDQFDALVIGASSPFEISFPLAMMWGIVGCVASFAASLVREKEKGTYLRLRSAPVQSWQILAGKACAMFVSAAAILTLLTLISMLLGVRVPDPLKLAVVIAVVAYCFVGIMMLLSIFGKTERACDSAAWSILLVLTMFGGGMVPIEFLPDWMQAAGNVTPVKWGIRAIEGALWRQLTYQELLRPLGLLFAVGTACLAIGCWVFQRPEQG